MSEPRGGTKLVNCLKSATKGCHICLWYPGDEAPSIGADWITDYDDVDENERSGPDLAIDPEDYLFTVRNITTAPRTYYVSVQQAVISTEEGDVLETGGNRDDDGVCTETTTVILLIPPMRLVDVGYISCDDIKDSVIHSDIQVFSDTTGVNDHVSLCVELKTFPLEGSVPFLCTQGAAGSLTHFAHAGTNFALDLRCDIGTPVRSVCEGRVLDVRCDNKCGGIDVDNLYKWNSVTVQCLTSNTCFDYVHLSHGSITVKVGDIVTEGQIIAKSGDVGFTPEPHLHFQCLQSSAPNAPSIPIKFRFGSDTAAAIVAEAGEYYPPSMAPEARTT